MTQSSGAFAVLSLLPSRYSLTVTAPGFQTYVVPEFRLQGGEARTFNVQLQLGQVAEKVEVNATVIAVN